MDVSARLINLHNKVSTRCHILQYMYNVLHTCLIVMHDVALHIPCNGAVSEQAVKSAAHHYVVREVCVAFEIFDFFLTLFSCCFYTYL